VASAAQVQDLVTIYSSPVFNLIEVQYGEHYIERYIITGRGSALI